MTRQEVAAFIREKLKECEQLNDVELEALAVVVKNIQVRRRNSNRITDTTMRRYHSTVMGDR